MTFARCTPRAITFIALLSLAVVTSACAPEPPPETAAKVIVDFPSSVTSRAAYHNIRGPVWVFNFTFRELNGVAAEIDQKRMLVYATDGAVWGDTFFQDIYSHSKKSPIKLRPNGSSSYESFVYDTAEKCTFCGARAVWEYSGQDSRGNTVSGEVTFTLVK